MLMLVSGILMLIFGILMLRKKILMVRIFLLSIRIQLRRNDDEKFDEPNIFFVNNEKNDRLMNMFPKKSVYLQHQSLFYYEKETFLLFITTIALSGIV